MMIPGSDDGSNADAQDEEANKMAIVRVLFMIAKRTWMTMSILMMNDNHGCTL